MAYMSGLGLLPLALQFVVGFVIAVSLAIGFRVLIDTLNGIKYAIQELRLEIKEALKSFNR